MRHLKSWTITIIVGEVIHKAFSQDPCAEKLKNYLLEKIPEGNYYSV